MTNHDIRAKIDSQNVNGLILINGGGIVALLAFLPHILKEHEYICLTRSIFIGFLMLILGLTSSLVHNHLRRRCSLAYDEGKPKKKWFIFGNEPIICHYSSVFMCLGYFFFILAGIIILIGGFSTLNQY
jgi:hypothetical protein